MDGYTWVVCVHADWTTSLHAFQVGSCLVRVHVLLLLVLLLVRVLLLLLLLVLLVLLVLLLVVVVLIFRCIALTILVVVLEHALLLPRREEACADSIDRQSSGASHEGRCNEKLS